MMAILHLDGFNVTPYSVSMTEGRKFDGAKTRYGLIPPVALEQIAQVLTYGASKYTTPDSDGAENWRKVPDGRRRYFDALMRHAWAYARGEEKDPESGLPHLAHAGACILFLLSELDGDKKP
jgi:hypothetical protein